MQEKPSWGDLLQRLADHCRPKTRRDKRERASVLSPKPLSFVAFKMGRLRGVRKEDILIDT
jgi:hypothetical protein